MITPDATPDAAPDVSPGAPPPDAAPPGLASRQDRRGRYVHPWPLRRPGGRGFRDVLRWQLQRMRDGVEPAPDPASIPRATPAFARPRAAPGELRITWVGHATFLLQLGPVNVLTDPMWSRRASPLPWFGPRRLVPPGVSFEALPPIDVVVLSHDHYDHLDDATVRRLARGSNEIRWVAPLGYTEWLRRRGATHITELDWWRHVDVETRAGSLTATAAPAQHWTRRSPLSERTRLWASYRLSVPGAGSLFFCGDSGYFDAFASIGSALGPFDAVLLPIGAYEPRWFMQAAHMNPEEAVQAWCDLGGRGTFVGMHWGTFRLTDEPPLEPPARTRAAWADRALPAADLWIPRHGETRVLAPGRAD